MAIGLIYKYKIYFAALIFISGCTHITVYTDGDVATERVFGFPLVRVDGNGGPIVVKASSWGVYKSPRTLNIGYVNEVFMLTDGKCELILFEPHCENLEEIISLIDVNKSICTTL